MKFILSIISIVIITGCGSDIDDAKQFPHNSYMWERLIYRASTGRGNNEFEKNRDRKAAKREIEALKDKIFFTFRTVYRIDAWEAESKKLSTWGNIKEGKLPSWEDGKRLLAEPKAGTYLPWLITNYDYDTKSFKIIPAPFDCYCSGNCIANVSHLRCFGDPPPTAETEDGGENYSPAFASGDAWGWYNEKVLEIRMNEKDAEKFVNSFGRNSFRIKIYYKYYGSSDNAVIIMVEGLAKGRKGTEEILFGTEYHDSEDDTKYKAGGSDSYYWSHFTR